MCIIYEKKIVEENEGENVHQRTLVAFPLQTLIAIFGRIVLAIEKNALS